MLDRRDFLRCTATAATTILLSDHWWMRDVSAAEHSSQVKITDLAVIRLREKGSNGQARDFLEVTTNSDLDGVSGELFMDTPRQLNEMRPRLRQLLVGRDPQDRKLDATWMWKGRNCPAEYIE